METRRRNSDSEEKQRKRPPDDEDVTNLGTVKNKKRTTTATIATGVKSEDNKNGIVHITSLSNDILGKIFQYLNLVDGPLQMTETCHHFAKSLDKRVVVHNSCGVDNKLLRKALLANNTDMEAILRDDSRVKDNITSCCNNCDHTTRELVKKCNAPPIFYFDENNYDPDDVDECNHMKYICKECTVCSDVYCYVCDTYGTLREILILF